jgi:hypothetical protein
MKIRSVLCVLLLSACQKSAPPPPPQLEIDRLIEDLASSPIHEEITSELSAWRALGVARIRTEPANGTIDHKATLLDTQGQKVGSIEVWSSEESDGWLTVITRIAGHQAKIELGQGGLLRLTDLATGRTGSTRFDLKTKTFESDPELDRLQTQFGEIIPLAMGTVNALAMQYRSDTAPEEGADQSPFDPVDPSKDPLWACSGSWYRGGAYWGTRSGCCVIARENAANQCSNWSCYGCCFYRSCDSWCSRGDYFCVCGISGRSCG